MSESHWTDTTSNMAGVRASSSSVPRWTLASKTGNVFRKADGEKSDVKAAVLIQVDAGEGGSQPDGVQTKGRGESKVFPLSIKASQEVSEVAARASQSSRGVSEQATERVSLKAESLKHPDLSNLSGTQGTQQRTSSVCWNLDRKIYEAVCPDGFLDTFFVFPPSLKSGDKLPPLFIRAFSNGETIFRFQGEYNAEDDNLDFFLEGPVGWVYKASLQVDFPGVPYVWKIKRHGHTQIGRLHDACRLFVPRTQCLARQGLLSAGADVLKRWTFRGRAIPEQFGRLRLKVRLTPARCVQNQDSNRLSQGLGAYRHIGAGTCMTAESASDSQQVAMAPHPNLLRAKEATSTYYGQPSQGDEATAKSLRKSAGNVPGRGQGGTEEIS